MLHASGGNNMAQHCPRVCVCVFVCWNFACVFSCRLCMRMNPYKILVCIKAYALSFPSAVRVPGSIQHLDQQVSPSCTATLTHSTDLHPPAEGEAAQLLTFPRLRTQSHIVPCYCNRVPAMFHHVQQSGDSVSESRIVLFCVSCRIMYSDSVDFILEDYISPHGLLTDAWCPVVAGSVVTQPPGGLALLIVPVICLKYTAWKMGGIIIKVFVFLSANLCSIMYSWCWRYNKLCNTVHLIPSVATGSGKVCVFSLASGSLREPGINNHNISLFLLVSLQVWLSSPWAHSHDGQSPGPPLNTLQQLPRWPITILDSNMLSCWQPIKR